MSMLLKPLRAFVPLSVKEFLYSLKERKPQIVSLDGFKLAVHQHDIIISESIKNSGVWAESETRLFRELITPGMVVIDVGANIGYFSLLASTLVGPLGEVHAFEPDPVNCGLLKKNVRMNRASNIKVVQGALSNNDDPVPLFLNSDNKGDHRIWEASGESRTKITVKATTLDRYLEENALTPSFIKIDVQGAEGQVLEGMKETLILRPPQFMILELWPEALRKCETNPEQMVKLIADAGFTIRVVADDQLLGENVIINESFTSANAQALVDIADAAPYQQIDLICAR
jgi:FkbM family methyltransferase